MGQHHQDLVKLSKEVADFILSHNNKGQFNSAMRDRGNFDWYIQKLVEAKQADVHIKDGRITGAMCWMWTNNTGVRGVSKSEWYLPEIISTGNILYVAVAALDGQEDMYKTIRKLRYQAHIREVYHVAWANYKRDGKVKTRRIL